MWLFWLFMRKNISKQHDRCALSLRSMSLRDSIRELFGTRLYHYSGQYTDASRYSVTTQPRNVQNIAIVQFRLAISLMSPSCVCLCSLLLFLIQSSRFLLIRQTNYYNI